jgi:uncharacterized protein YcbK (DUF882 family)
MANKKLVIAAIAVATTLVVSGCAKQSYSTSTAGATVFGSGQVTYNDTKWCLPGKLKRVLKDVSQQFGTVSVHSTKRRWLENRRKGGAKNSYHRRCEAIDFAVRGDHDPAAVIAFLKSKRAVGGYKYYPGGHYHIDTGPRRTW